MRWWPRTLRWKLLLGLILLEALSITMFALLVVRLQGRDLRQHARERLGSQVSSVASQAQEAMLENRPDWLAASVRMMGKAPSVAQAKVTDPAGNVIAVSPGLPNKTVLDPAEKEQIALIRGNTVRTFSFGNDSWGLLTHGKDRWESVQPIYFGTTLAGYAWVESDRVWDRDQILIVVRGTLIFGLIWIGASSLLVWFISGSISRPLAILHAGTTALMKSPEGSEGFPLPVRGNNEFTELIEAFNGMVASIDEQRSGLNDTLSLLDSMLANAPIGLAFFDRRCRCVRVNHVFARLIEVPVSRNLCKTLPELLPEPTGRQLEDAIGRVFANESAEYEIEIEGVGGKPRKPWTWLVSAYPIRTIPNQVRWAGLIVQDISERKRSEETLRKTEKLAATGRLAASIAHEVNNPLEAITNLFYFLRTFG